MSPIWLSPKYSKIFKGTIGPVTVRISVLKALLAGDDDHERVLRGRYDSALLLAAKAYMDIAPPIVHAANLEAPTHRHPQPNCAPNFDFLVRSARNP
jgi:hypothetical protein